MIIKCFVLFVSLIGIISSQKLKCGEEGFKVVDKTLSRMFVIGDERIWPVDEATMKPFCKYDCQL